MGYLYLNTMSASKIYRDDRLGTIQSFKVTNEYKLNSNILINWLDMIVYI